ncbi:MAG: hypothetical protein ACTSQA_01520 [Candidatus Heimdallarchaeaceae archaeon]
MKQSNINRIITSLFLVYVIWNYMIYIAIDYKWDSFMGWHWFVGAMMLIFSGVLWITFWFASEQQGVKDG